MAVWCYTISSRLLFLLRVDQSLKEVHAAVIGSVVVTLDGDLEFSLLLSSHRAVTRSQKELSYE